MRQIKETKGPTVAQMDEKFPGLHWRYASKNAVSKHAIRITGSLATVRAYARPECGKVPSYSGPGWLGHGNQEEYERLDELPPCRRCMEKLVPDTPPRIQTSYPSKVY